MDQVFQRLTWARIRICRELAEGYSQPKIAHRLGMSVYGVRSSIEDLRDITGISEASEIGRWWRKGGSIRYLRFVAREAGVDLRHLGSTLDEVD